MTPSQQEVERALSHFDDPGMVWHGDDGEKGRTLVAEVRRLRELNAQLLTAALRRRQKNWNEGD